MRYRRLFETAQDGILILDGKTGRIIDVNPFLLDLLNYSYDSIIGLELWEIGLFADIASNQAAFGKLQKDEYIRYENRPLRTNTGREVQVEFVSNVYYVGAERVIQCNIRDISERSKIQTVANERVAALEIASKAKDDVISILSHELRTPLAAIMAMTDVVELGQDFAEKMPARGDAARFDRSAVSLIRRNVQTLSRLLGELLDLTRIAKGKVQLELASVDAHEVIRFVLQNLEAVHRTKDLTIDLHLLAPHSLIRADSIKLEQVLTNLIGNAVKFTDKRGTVSILTRNEAGNRLVVEVSDTGIGISPDAISRIFAPFEQGDASIHPRFGGLGLGLSIAHALTDAHGGTLEASSPGLNLGAKFTARFKLQEFPSPGFGRSVPATVSSKGMRILFVEDHVDIRFCVTQLLEAQGYTVEVAGEMNTALALGSRAHFDLLIADISLPDGNGLDLLDALKKTSPNLLGIVTSGHGSQQYVDDALAAGFSAHLEKPVQFSALRTAIERLLPQAKAAGQRQLRE